MLIVEEHAIASLFSTSRGYAAEAYHPHSICMAASKHVPSAIRYGRYAALWLEIPRSARSIPINNRPAVFNELALWVRTARMSGVPACLVGLRGVAWQNEHMARLVTDRIIHESRHQLCHYGLAMIETDQPSRVSYHAFTTFSAESGLCRCPPDTEHIHEFSKNVQHTTVRRVRTETELFQRLMTTWLFASAPAHSGDRPRLRSIPDSTPTTGGSTKRVHFEPQRAAENHRYSELHLSEQSAQTVVAFPTASKERAKERKKAGQKPRKLPKVVEDHYDDLGDDLSGLGSDLTYLSADVVRETLDIDSDYDTDDEQFVQGLSICYLKGSGAIEFLPEGAMRFPLLDNLLQFLATAGDGLDLCEICGGSARTSQVAVRRRLHAGRNFDLVANIDVGLSHNQTLILEYLDHHQVLVVVMSPSCRTLGAPASINQAVNYETWLQHFEEDKPHIEFCGKVALTQLQQSRHFFNEQSHPTWLWHVDPWPRVGQHSQVVTKVLDQCMLGRTGPRGLPAKQPTELIASAPELLAAFENLRCQGKHQHDDCWGNSPQLRKSQEWLWPFADRLVTGIVRLKARHRQNMYPSVGVGDGPPGTVVDPPTAGRSVLEAAPPPPVEGDEPWRKCPGCRDRKAATRREHTREPDVCKYPLTEPELAWTCPGCAREPMRPRGHNDHTDIFGECRWAEATSRTGAPRRGRHPRVASRPASSDPSADLPGPALNPANDTPVAEPLTDNVVEDEAGSASSGAAPAVGTPSPAGARSKNRMRDQRERRDAQPRVREAGAGEAAVDWTSFDVSRSLRILRTGTEAQKRREVRKLHLRWWHATRNQMEQIFDAASLPQSIKDQVRDVINTCRECRPWAPSGNEPTPSVELAIKQDQQVEADILFYKRHLVWHMLDRADRWHAASIISDKAAPTLQEAIDVTWVQLWGPFLFLIIDGESGVNCPETETHLKRHGITIRLRAPGQHARMLERRGALVRHTMHTSEEQLRKEGIVVTIRQLLAEAVFAGNALVSVGGVTPYNARLGRQPRMLPDILALPTDAAPGAGRSPHRVREISLQRMIESTALSRIRRASRSMTTTPGEVLDYKPGELVDYHRPQASKDSSGWEGPATILENIPARGQVRIATGNTEIRCAYKDVRRFLEYLVLLFGIHTKPGSAPHAVVGIIEECLSQMEPNKIHRFGYVQDNGIWKITNSTKNAVQLTCALEHFVSNIVHYSHVVAVRLGRGVSRFPKDTSAESSVLLWWNRSIESVSTFESDGNGPISTASVVGPEWPRMNYMQIILSQVAGIQLSDILDPESPLADNASDRSFGADASGRSDISDPDRLSAIDEGNEDDVDSNFLLKPEWCDQDDWSHCTPEERQIFVAIERDADAEYIELETAESAQQPQTSTRESVQVGLHYLTFGADDALLNQVGDTDDSGNAYVEILFPGDTAKLILAEPPPDGSTARLRVYLAPLKTAVVERDTDLLTDAEYYKFAGEVSAAILEELRIWIVHQCFTRRPRKGARNVLDVRWVGKWKWVKSKIDPSKKVRIIRMRMTLRGFKDVDAADLITFAGTSSRVSQRIVVSEACCRGWPLAAIDVKKAFLKGITYAELAATTNEPAREVNFELSPDAVAILRQCPGFENFDPTREVLHNTKPGTGCKDAPRCFGIKFTRATNDEFGAKSTTHDEQFIVRHTEGKLDFLGAKHVDDVKAGCPPDILKEFISKLEKVFGKGELDITLHNFTCCGVRHSLTDKSYEMDQIEYVNALKPIENKEMVGKSNDQPADPYNAQLFLSLLMALAFSLLTRVDLGAYVVALQRIAQSPKCLHIRRLNALVRWAQRNPLKLVYHFMTCAGQLMCDSDTGYRREVDEEGNTDGRAARGANYMRIGTSGNERVVHLIDWLVGSVKQVVRSTFTAETHGVIGTVDNAIVLSTALHEIKHGPLSTTIAKQLADYGGADFEVEVVTDARNLLLALGSARLKPPAERSFIVHLLWLREKILRGVIRRLTWCDTRDMTSDGHTKGSVSRDAIRKLAAGRLQRQFATESLTADDIPHAVTQVSEPAALGGHGGSLATLMTTKVTQDRNYQKPYSSSPISLCMVVTSTCSVPDDDARLRVTPDAPELNPFELLGCSNLTFRDALQKTPSDWAKIWRKASVTLHPDKFDLQGVTWEHANRRFQTATAAKDVLVKDESDIAARAQQFELISKFLSHQALPSSSAASSSADCPMPSSAARRLTPGEHFAQTVVLQSLFQRTRCNKTRSQGGDLPEGAIVAGQAEHEKAVAEYKRANSLKQPAARFPVGPEKRDERAALAKDLQHEKIQRKLTRVQRSHPARKSLVRLRRAAKDWTRAAEFNQAVAREGAQRRAEIEGKSTTSVDVRQAWRKYRRGQEEWEPPPDPKYRHYRGSKQKAKDRRFSKARKALKRATQGPAPMLTDGTVHLDAEDDGRLAAVPAATPGEKRKRKRKRTQQSSLGAAEEDWEQIDVESDWEQITVEAAPATQLMKPKSKATAGPKAVTPASVPRLLQPTSKVAARPRVYPVAPWRRR